jgi:8-oxo-dGTP pyrophosphatase MutT (NUDIX family)
MHNPISRLREQLQAPLPGRAAQYRMAHAVRQSYVPPPADAREASVMALFFPQAKEWQLTLIQRTSHNPKDRHGGQIGFPGGKREAQDPDLTATALRETEEEIGVSAADIQLLGRLSELYIPVSNFLVHPFVGYLDYAPSFRPQASEVARVLTVPFKDVVAPESRQLTNIHIAPQMVLRDVPHFALAGQVVWGATAMMISELLAVLESSPS